MKKWFRLFCLFLVFVVLIGCTNAGGGTQNRPPKIDSFTPPVKQIEIGLNEVLDLSVISSDPDRDTLQYLWEHTGDGDLLDSTSSSTTLFGPEKEGSATIKVTVSDGKGGMVSHTWQINIVDREEKPIVFEDSNLERVIRNAIGKTSGELMPSDVYWIVELDALGQGITSLEGIEHLASLKHLQLGHNQINDIRPLADLTNLEELYLYENQISDISVLANLTGLKDLHLYDNQISDISSLAGLTNLQVLMLEHNQISDINVLAELKNLEYISAANNQLAISMHSQA
jgi:hypothetical protein